MLGAHLLTARRDHRFHLHLDIADRERLERGLHDGLPLVSLTFPASTSGNQLLRIITFSFPQHRPSKRWRIRPGASVLGAEPSGANGSQLEAKRAF